MPIGKINRAARNNIARVCLTKEEHSLIKAAASAKDMSMSSYIARATLNAVHQDQLKKDSKYGD